MMFNQHKIASVLTIVGLLPVAAHILLGPALVSPPFAIGGLVIATASGGYLAARSRGAKHGVGPSNRRTK